MKSKKRRPRVFQEAEIVPQYQGGGVYTPGVMPYEVVPINTPGLSIPMPRPVSAMDPAAMLNRQLLLDQRQQAIDLRKQQADDKALATTQANFLDLQDKLFGDVHNPYQQRQLEELREAKRIPENITSDVFSNGMRLKELEFSISQAVVDPKFKSVMAEVGAVNKLRESAARTLTQEEYANWQVEYDKYQFSEDGKYDINNLAPSKYKTKTVPKDTDYASWLDSPSNREYLAGVDFKNQASLDQYYSDLAGEFGAKGADEAVRRGYIEYVDPNNPDYGVILTDKGKELAQQKAEKARAIKEGKLDQWIAQRRISQQITQENRVFSDQITDQNRAEREAKAEAAGGSPSASRGKTMTEKERKARTLLIPLEKKYGQFDMNEKLPNGRTIYEEMWTATGRDGAEEEAIGYIEGYLKSKNKGKAPEQPEKRGDFIPGYDPNRKSVEEQLDD